MLLTGDSTTITDDTVTEDEESNVPNKQSAIDVTSPVEAYKWRQLTWSSHQGLPVGLQGSTLQLHHCDERLSVAGLELSQGVACSAHARKNVISHARARK